MRPISERRVDERRERAARSHLDENPCSVAVHCDDHLGESHRAREVLAQAVGDRLGVRGVTRSIEVRVNGPIEHGLKRGSRQPRERLASGRHERRVEGRRYREPPPLYATGRGALECLAYGSGRAGDDRLGGTVPVGDLNAIQAVDQRVGFRAACQERRHGSGLARVGCTHQATPRCRKRRKRGRIKRARRVQCDKLAVAVARDEVGLAAQAAQQAQKTDARSPHRRLRDLGLDKCLPRLFARLLAVSGNRIDPPQKRRASYSRESPVELFERSSDLRKNHGQLTEHTGCLRSLTGEHKRNLGAGEGGLGFEENATRIVNAAPT